MKNLPKLKKPKSLLSTLSSLLLVSCASCGPTPPDVPVCEHLGTHMGTNKANGHIEIRPSPACLNALGESVCGHCTYILSGKEIYVGEAQSSWLNGKPWSQIRAQSVLVPAEESYAPMATYMINACRARKCSNTVDRFQIRLSPLSILK